MDEPHRAPMGDEVLNQTRIADDDRLLQLEIEDHVEHIGGERLLKRFTGLLPSSDAVRRPNHLDQALKLS